MTQCFYCNFSYIYYSYLCVAWQIPPIVPFSIINSISVSVNNSNSTPVFFKQAYHANPGADTKNIGSSSYFSRHIFLKFSYTSASNNVSL